MLGKIDLSEEVKNKHVLIDTCILINWVDAAKGGSYAYKDLIDYLQNAGCQLVINDAIYFEFSRVAKNSSELERLNKLMVDLATFTLPVHKKNFEEAHRLALLYSQERKQFARQISLADCINASYLLKDDIILITEDLQDYPTHIFDCFYVWPLSIRTQSFTRIAAVGFFRLNREKLNAQIDKYQIS